MTTRLDGRTAFVTGGAAGLGSVISRYLGDAGASGLVLDAAARCPELPAGWSSLQGDVASEKDVAAAVASIDERFGGLDIVIANAGLVPPWRETANLDLDEWDRVFAVNVRGVAATIKHSVPLLRKNGGSIVVMGSLNSRRAHPQQCLYTATKHAALGIVRAAALDLGRFGIRVNAIGPGPVATNALTERIRHRAAEGGPAVDDALAQYAGETALGAIATADEVARCALFLASDASSGITGQILPIDAGLP